MEQKTLTLELSRAKEGRDAGKRLTDRVKEAERKLADGKEGFTGWVSLPQSYSEEEIAQIIRVGEEIRGKCQAFVIIGIGGSYLGTRACVEMMSHSFPKEMGESPQIYFAGHNISGTYLSELMEAIGQKELCICVISKSGTTTEPSIAFAVLKDHLFQKYGQEEGAKRIYAITDEAKGQLREETDRMGYTSFVVPDDVGGRYSVLTPVGLLPISAAGIDIRQMLAGAADWAKSQDCLELCRSYSAARAALYESGKAMEIFQAYEPKLTYFTEWLKQLFGESEGKDGKGLFPSILQFSTDLHSMGQFLQQGSQIFIETVLNVTDPKKDLTVPKSAGEQLAGKSMNQVNQAAVAGVAAAHEGDNIPMIQINIPELNPYYFGQLVYFFEYSCALSGYLIGVNPFNQPGVESYKDKMRAFLKSGD